MTVKRRTKIVATLGPSTSSPEALDALIDAGVNVVRLNFSHGSAQEHLELAEAVRNRARAYGRQVGVLADMQGPKIRIARFTTGKVFLEEDDEFVNEIMFQVKYMTETINSFQKFIMPSTQKIVFDINESVEEMLEIIRHNIKYNYIDVNVNVEPNTNLMILGYKNELMQTLLNIVNNAKESIIKEKSKDKITQGTIEINIKNVNNKVQIDISDNGSGIPQKYINQIFEPYFTTKKDGHGIGLYMARLIIEDKIGGTINASNTQDGARFTIQLELTK